MSRRDYSAADRERWVAEDPAVKRSDRDDFARDRGRLIHSASLRRLAAKTQVVSPDSDDFVRNRLTHSLEVAQIGREFGAALGCSADVVDTAALAHDLGHPPFGHNGESALDEIATDIGGFEGNAQTLRILTRLEAKRFHPDGRSAGLNLTRASLDAATKYPWPRGAVVGRAKFGVYEDDREAFAWMRSGRPDGERCIEADVMDWSDDVAYSVHDVEDAIASRRLDPRRLRDRAEIGAVLAVAQGAYAADLTAGDVGAALERLLALGVVPAAYDGTRRDLAALKDMTSRLIGRFVVASEVATREAFGAGPLRRYAATLVVPDATRAECAVLKAVAAHFVMNVDERLAQMVTQREVIAGLVAQFSAHPERLDVEEQVDFAAADSDAARLRVVIDQVASLSDLRAWSVARAWGLT
ncbi:MAG: deoxyguanosinetriphosphate triphosphohydrolase [Tetrasphaera sp.]|nr:deoxyguanosinetriphosphate triphosphohydrolase [Tetrasphaera sp.]